MKKSSLLKMKNLPATEEMLAVAREDVPVKVGSGWNTFYRCRYSGFARSTVAPAFLCGVSVDFLDAAAVQTEPHKNVGPIRLFSQFDCHR